MQSCALKPAETKLNDQDPFTEEFLKGDEHAHILYEVMNLVTRDSVIAVNYGKTTGIQMTLGLIDNNTGYRYDYLLFRSKESLEYQVFGPDCFLKISTENLETHLKTELIDNGINGKVNSAIVFYQDKGGIRTIVVDGVQELSKNDVDRIKATELYEEAMNVLYNALNLPDYISYPSN